MFLLNPLNSYRPSYMGMEIRTSPYLTKKIEDWSNVRSPSRAKRRMKYGKKQNIVIKEIPSEEVLILEGKTIMMHPEIYEDFILKMKEKTYANSF